MVHLDKPQIDGILDMYKPEARYLLEADIELPKLEGKILMPEETFYMPEGINTNHINNGESTIISNQAVFLLYRDALLKGELGLPKINEQEITSQYINNVFIKKEETTFEKFAKRKDQEYKIHIVHKKLRKRNNIFFVWYDLNIEGFLKSKIAGGIILES